MKHLLLTTIAAVVLVGCGSKTGVEKIDYDTLQGWITSGKEVNGYIEYPTPNSSALCTITGFRIENGNKIPFAFEDRLIEGREKFLIENAGFQPREKNTLLTAFIVNLLPILLLSISLLVGVLVVALIIFFIKRAAKSGKNPK